MQAGLNALILGSTGAVGRELVKQLLSCQKWSSVYCIVRKQLQEWANLVNKEKLKVQIVDMDKLQKIEEWKYENIDALFCCLGSRVQYGEETFTKIDKTYPLLAADIAIKNNIPHYLLVSSGSTDPTSMFMYLRVKGQAERDLALKKMNLLSIIKPGLIQDRTNARFGQKFASWIPFFPKINCNKLAKCLKIIAEKNASQASKMNSQIKIYENDCLLKEFQNQNKK